MGVRPLSNYGDIDSYLSNPFGQGYNLDSYPRFRGLDRASGNTPDFPESELGHDGKAAMLYVLICLCLSLAGVAGLQFFYMVYLERVDREHKKRIIVLERRVRNLTTRLKESEKTIAERNELIEAIYDDLDLEDEELWADVIEER